MKRTLILSLLALGALAGCRQAEQEAPEAASGKTVRFQAGMADTRTAFEAPENGLYRTRWTENDTDVLLSLNYGKAEPSSVTPSADGLTAAFEATFDAASAVAPYTFYAVSPASAARAISPSRSAWSVYIAADQTPSALSVDEAAQLLVAKSAPAATLPDEVDLHFSHLTAYGRIALKNLDLGEAKAERVELIFSTPVVGEWYWGEDGTLTPNGDSHTVTLRTDASGDLWFACAPVSVGGETLTLKVYTDQRVYTRSITFPEGRSFSPGKVARFSVDMADAEMEEYTGSFYLLTDPSLLTEGDEIIIVNQERTYALGAQNDSGTPHRDQVSVTVTDDRVDDPGEATVLTLEPGSASGTWSFRTAGGYLSAAASKNILEESSVKDGLSSWKVTLTDGVARIQAQSGSSNLLRYNSMATRFSCYKASSTNMSDTKIYRRSSSGSSPLVIDPLTEQDAYGCYFSGAEWTYSKDGDQLLRSYPGDGTVTFVLLNAPTSRQFEVTGYDPTLTLGQEARVSVSFRRRKTVVLSDVFTLTVVKEDGPKVWLGDGTGQGIILKK